MIKIETINYFELLDYQRKKMIAELDTYSEKQLLFKPKKDGWSMAQVIDHLYLVEKQAKNYIDNKLREQKENIPPTNWKSGFRKNILNIALSLPFKFKIPTTLIQPNRNDYIQAKEDWARIRLEYKNLLHQLDKDYFSKHLFKHPLVGKMAMLDMFKFLQVHAQHHSLQIDRITHHPLFMK